MWRARLRESAEHGLDKSGDRRDTVRKLGLLDVSLRQSAGRARSDRKKRGGSGWGGVGRCTSSAGQPVEEKFLARTSCPFCSKNAEKRVL